MRSVLPKVPNHSSSTSIRAFEMAESIAVIARRAEPRRNITKAQLHSSVVSTNGTVFQVQTIADEMPTIILKSGKKLNYWLSLALQRMATVAFL